MLLDNCNINIPEMRPPVININFWVISETINGIYYPKYAMILKYVSVFIFAHNPGKKFSQEFYFFHSQNVTQYLVIISKYLNLTL